MWALGVTLYVMTVGQLPFWSRSLNLLELAASIANDNPCAPPVPQQRAAHRSPSVVSEDGTAGRRERGATQFARLAPSLQALLRQMLQKDPRRRISVEGCLQSEWCTFGGQLPVDDVSPVPVQRRLKLPEDGDSDRRTKAKLAARGACLAV